MDACKSAAADAYWQRFLKDTGRDAGEGYRECFHFDLTEKWADKLLVLVLQGKKRATASSLYYFRQNGLPLPRVGECSIVTNWAGEPKCVIETTAVTVLPFDKITFGIAAREGEDDTLESWRQGHERFFTEEGKSEGYLFTPDMPVVFEDFRVVYR